LTEEFFKNIYLWSLVCTLQQGILGCRFRLKGWLQRACDRDFACRIQWEIVLRGKSGSSVLRANMCDCQRRKIKIKVCGALSVRCNRVYLDLGLGFRLKVWLQRVCVTESLIAEFNGRLW
jgi:hypothetical protein